MHKADALLFKILPLIFAVPLTLRILPDGYLPPEILSYFKSIDVESFTYAVILYVMTFVSFYELHFTLPSAVHGATGMLSTKFLHRLGVGGFFMLVLGLIGMVLATFVLITGFTFAVESQIGTIIVWYMIIEVFVLGWSARVQIFEGRHILQKTSTSNYG